MPVELMTLALSLVFAVVWALVGQIVVSNR